MVEETPELTGGRLLARNTLFNLIGQGAPILIALFAIPILIKSLGTDRFGVLTLAWVVIGYFSLFDFGLGRALTKLVAEKLGAGNEREIPSIVWTTLLLMMFFGLAGAVTLGLLSNWLIRHVLKVPEILKTETLHSFYLLAFSIPIVITTAGLRGVLEAKQRFELVNIVRIFMGAFTYLGPLFVLPFSRSLFSVVVVLVIGRFLACFVHLILCFRVMPSLRHDLAINQSMVKPLIYFGGWMTITNVIGPFMVYLDRFLISALVSVKAVAYYTIPYEMITKLLIIPGALTGVLLPVFSTSYAQNSRETIELFARVVKYTFLLVFPITLSIVIFAREGLGLWIDDEFARNSAFVLQLLTIGVFIISMSQIFFVLLQSIGRPDITAKLNLVEFPFYLFFAWLLIGDYGIKGAALIWVIRILIDAALLLVITVLVLPKSASPIRGISIMVSVSLIIFCVACSIEGFVAKSIFLFWTLVSFIIFVWFRLLSSEERMVVKDHIRRRVRTILI